MVESGLDDSSSPESGCALPLPLAWLRFRDRLNFCSQNSIDTKLRS